MEPKIRLKGFGGEWKTYKIGNLTSITTGATPSTSISSYWDNGTIRWMSSGELNNRHIYDVKGRITEDGYHSCGTHLIPPGCVLIGLAGQGKTRGTAAINHGELCTNQSIAALLPNAQMFDSSYLYHYIDNKYLELRGMSTGDGGRGGLNKQILLDFEVKLPSMEEQIALASYFDSIDSLIQSTTKKIESLKQVKAASLQSMFPQEGETTPRVRFKGFEGEWEKVSLGSLFSERSEYDINAEMLSVTQNKGIIKAADNGRFDNSNNDKSKYKLVKVNDIAYNSMRMWQGACGCSTLEGIVSPAYTVISPIGNLCSKFFYYMFKTNKMLKVFRLASQGLTSDTWNLKFPAFGKLKITYPYSIDEQIQIAAYFNSLDHQITLQTQRLEKLKQIKAACLDNMFV